MVMDWRNFSLLILWENIKKMNTTSENIKYLIYNRKFLCQHNKLHPLTDRRGNWVSETLYREIENIIQHYSQKYITSEVEEDLSNQKWTNCELDYGLFCCSDCTK